MKLLRICLLVLLAVSLPIRGAMAANLLCPAGEATPMVAAAHDHADMPDDHASAHHHASSDAPDDDASAGDHSTNCHFCASSCCMASMIGTVPSLGPAGLASSVTFPALTPSVAAFQSDGQDRPPRTC